MSRILLVDNEHRDIECLLELLDEIEPGVVDHVENAEEALKIIKRRVRYPYEALIVDYNLGSGDIADINGSYLLHIIDGNLEEVVTSGHCSKDEIESANSFNDLRKLKNADNDIINTLEEIFGTLGKYVLFVNEFSKSAPMKIIFAGEYDGTYRDLDCDPIKKDYQDGECGVEVVEALIKLKVLEEFEAKSVLTERGLLPFE